MATKSAKPRQGQNGKPKTAKPSQAQNGILGGETCVAVGIPGMSSLVKFCFPRDATVKSNRRG